MHGVVSLLDHKHHQLVKDLWAELAREFAVRQVYKAPEPHFSYQLAIHYDVKSLESALRRFAASRISFQVRAGGLGIFTGPHPVVYFPVVRSLELMRFHEALWQAISGTVSVMHEKSVEDRISGKYQKRWRTAFSWVNSPTSALFLHSDRIREEVS